MTTLLGDEAVKLIDEHDPKKPLFLYLAFTAPHAPYQAPQEYLDKYGSIADPARRAYAAMVTAMDDQIGRVIDALDKQKMLDDTLIVFHSDNGGTRDAMFAGQMADVSKIKIPCDNGPYRGGKGQLFEGGCRVAACASWPGRIQPGVVTGMFHAVDLYPTIAALAGASTAKCKPLDGVNVWDTIASNKASPRTELVYNIEPFRAGLRQGDWKLIWRTLVPTSVDLYNLAEDPYEKNNLAAAHPDKVVAMQERVNALGKECAKPLFLAYLAETGLKHAAPIIASEEGQPRALIGGGSPTITDEGFGDSDH